MTTKPTTLQWAVVMTAFHGGGLVSRHHTREAAEQAAHRQRLRDCVCCCAVVVRSCNVDSLPLAIDADSPYSPAR
jgi:hypothetical protein